MNYLELVQKTVLYAPIAGKGPADVENLANEPREYQLVVQWIRDAWHQVQNSRRDWKWMQRASQFSTQIGKNIYTLADIAATDPEVARLRRWYRNDFRQVQGESEDRPVNYMQEALYERRYSNKPPSTQGHPIALTIRERDLAVWLYPMPDDVYPIHMRYALRASELVKNTDVPEMPEEYHELLVWKAIEQFGYYHNAVERVQSGVKRAREINNELVNSSTTDMVLADNPLA